MKSSRHNVDSLDPAVAMNPDAQSLFQRHRTFRRQDRRAATLGQRDGQCRLGIDMPAVLGQYPDIELRVGFAQRLSQAVAGMSAADDDHWLGR
ncbi:hypothetical protein D3C85_1412050 [compost metagenome]